MKYSRQPPLINPLSHRLGSTPIRTGEEKPVYRDKPKLIVFSQSRCYPGVAKVLVPFLKRCRYGAGRCVPVLLRSNAVASRFIPVASGPVTFMPPCLPVMKMLATKVNRDGIRVNRDANGVNRDVTGANRD